MNLFLQNSQPNILPSSYGILTAAHLSEEPNLWLDKLILHNDIVPRSTTLSVK